MIGTQKMGGKVRECGIWTELSAGVLLLLFKREYLFGSLGIF